MQDSILSSEKGLDIPFFFNYLQPSLKDNLNGFLLSTLGNMLALDYAFRKTDPKSKVTKESYAEQALKKLKIYLAGKTIDDKEFSTAMSLFMIAISESEVYTEDKGMMAEYIVNNVIDVSKDNAKRSKEIIEAGLKEHGKDILEIIDTQPEKLSQIMSMAGDSSSLMKEIHKTNSSYKKSTEKAIEAKSIYSLVGASVVTVIGIAASSVLGGIAPFVIIPAALASLKAGAEAGEKVAEQVSGKILSPSPTTEIALKKLSKSLDLKIEQMRSIQPSKQKKTEINLNKTQVMDILSQIHNNLSIEEIKESKTKILNQTKAKEVGRNL